MTASKNFPKLPQDWTEELGILPNHAQKIFTRVFKKNSTRHQRLLFIVHGIGEQSDRFTHFPHYLHTSFDVVALIDLPGHGHSEGKRGHIESFDEYSQAVVAAFLHFQAQFPKIKNHHWLGCSMGGLITLRTMIRNPSLDLASVTVAEPQLGIAVQVPALKEFLGTLIEPLLGGIPLKNEIDASLLSHDVSVQTEYKSNPLNHELISPRLYINMKKEMAFLETYDGEFPYPLQMMIPLADQIVDWKKSIQFFKNLKMKNGLQKRLCTFPNFYHEIFNEDGRERAFTAFEEWITK